MEPDCISQSGGEKLFHDSNLPAFIFTLSLAGIERMSCRTFTAQHSTALLVVYSLPTAGNGSSGHPDRSYLGPD